MANAENLTRKSFTDGRDELNLAEFPISVLQRQQPVTEDGLKRDSVTYQASRYDPGTRQRLQQRVVLETNSRYGLPTPADENVVLALLCIAKHTHDFTSPVVSFSPRQLFRIMGWAPNSRSYVRLRDVLRRLKALVIRYENSWWDIEGRGYEAEFATGIISEYELARRTGRSAAGSQDDLLPQSDRSTVSVRPRAKSWVRWAPHFQQSLSKGNLKKLDLERLFSLRLPTSQRIYRFLDKRFYPRHEPPALEMDLQDFACGHIGLTQVSNVAELKRRLAPAIAELEAIGFIAPAKPNTRYCKVRAGVWRIRFVPGANFQMSASIVSRVVDHKAKVENVTPAAADQGLVTAFYQAWSGQAPPIGEKDLLQARFVQQGHGTTKALALVPVLVEIVKRKWPDCKSFSGAVAKYLPEAIYVYDQRQRRTDQQRQHRRRQCEERQEIARRLEERRQLETRWQALPETDRLAIQQRVCSQYPDHLHRPAILRRLCLESLAQQDGSSTPEVRQSGRADSNR
jgi:hypothetical protein